MHPTSSSSRELNVAEGGISHRIERKGDLKKSRAAVQRRYSCGKKEHWRKNSTAFSRGEGNSGKKKDFWTGEGLPSSVGRKRGDETKEGADLLIQGKREKTPGKRSRHEKGERPTIWWEREADLEGKNATRQILFASDKRGNRKKRTQVEESWLADSQNV